MKKTLHTIIFMIIVCMLAATAQGRDTLSECLAPPSRSGGLGRLLGESSALKSLIDPKDIATGKLLAQEISRIAVSDHPSEKDHVLYQRLLFTGLEIFTAYTPYLNEQGCGTMERIRSLLEKTRAPDFFWNEENFRTFQRMIALIPTVKNPNCELFVDIFAGLTEEQIGLLLLKPLDEIVYLQLSSYCPSRCFICVMGETGKGALKHMPFPLAVKIIRETAKYQKILYPCNASDPLHYHDPVIHATIADIVREARKSGFEKIPFITHRAIGSSEEVSEGIVRDVETPISISLHLYHKPVREYACEVVRAKARRELPPEERERLERKRNTLIGRYATRLWHLIRGTAKGTGSGLGFTSRAFLPARIEETLRPYPNTYAVLKEIQSMEEEMFYTLNKAWGNSDLRYAGPTDKRSQEIEWVGEAATTLRDLLRNMDGVKDPDQIVRAIQNEQKRMGRPFLDETPNKFNEDFCAVFQQDGTLKLQLMERESIRFRTVEEMFEDHRSTKFKVFAQFLKVLANADFVEKGHGAADGYQPPVSSKSLGLELAEAIRFHIPYSRFGDIAGARLSVPIDFRIARYYEFLFNFFMPKDQIRPLMENLTEENLKALYDRLRDVPFPNWIKFQVAGQALHAEVNLYLMDVSNPRSQRDIYTWCRFFDMPVHAFAPARGPAGCPDVQGATAGQGFFEEAA